jgi:hypothetical protein
MKRQLLFASLVSLLALFNVACGSHRDLDEDDDMRDAGEAGRSSAGKGGRGGTGGTGGTSGAAAVTVRCGSKQCAAPDNLLAALPFPTGIPAPVACCADEAKSECGSAPMAGGTCERPAVADARCPGVDLGQVGMMSGGDGMPMPGCCIENKCGLDGALFGRGCVENGEAKTMLSAIPFVGDLISVPPARACDAPLDADGGTDDAG